MKSKLSELAINGGQKAKKTPIKKKPRFNSDELKMLQKALKQNTLFYGFGTMVNTACKMMQKYTGMPYVVPCSSGSAAIHIGLAACGVGPGDEVIVTPNTDSGSVLGIIEEGAVPVFCDCTKTLQPSVETIKAKVTERTKAVIVVHLAGYPAPVDEIVDFCKTRGIEVIEDCAQSWGTRLNGRLVGTFGTVGAFSTNDFKHISTGDGGFVVTRDAELYRRMSNYSDKHYDRLFDGSLRQVHHGLNYRMTELQGAVAIAQLRKVKAITSTCHKLGKRLENKLKELYGGCMMPSIDGAYSTYWWTAVFVETEKITVSRDELVKALCAEGLPVGSYGKYDLIGTKLFQERVVRPWLKDERRFYPFVQPDGRSYVYSHTQTPIHKKMLETGIVVSMSNSYTARDIDEIADGFLKVFNFYKKR